MGLSGATFNKEGKVYGLLYPMGNPEQHCWEMAFYLSGTTRKRGITYLHKLLGSYCPIYKFELTMSEVRERAILVPFIPRDHEAELGRVVKVECRHKNGKRPACRQDN